MSDTQDPEALFLEHLRFIERMAAKFCRQGGMSDEEAADFASWAKERLIDNDYEKVRKFRGHSSFSTYVTAVLFKLYRDFHVANRGRWRPSAEARRQGADAVALERLVYRDGNSFEQAVSILLSRGETKCTSHELKKILQSLPASNRGRPKPVGEVHLGEVHSSDAADRGLLEDEAEAARARRNNAVRSAVAKLSPEDAHILHLRFFEGASVADIARALRLDQKPLYRRLERLFVRLREELEGSGISRGDVKEMLEEDEK
jgi:RNA polymerase sigma factor (sigma-70 family)